MQELEGEVWGVGSWLWRWLSAEETAIGTPTTMMQQKILISWRLDHAMGLHEHIA